MSTETDKRIVPTVARFIPGITLRKRDEGVQGYYVAAAGISGGWRAAVVMHSLDEGQSWLPVATIKRESVMGRVVALELHADDKFLDAVTVRLLHAGMSLESRAAGDVEAGANRLMIGREVLSFTEARLVAACTWRISGITRGRKQTSFATLPAAGQSATFIDERALVRVDVLDERARAGVYVVASAGQRVIDEPFAEFSDYLI